MQRTNRGYRLSSGRELGANRGLISIAFDGVRREWEIGEGYDGFLLTDGLPNMDSTAWDDPPWTPEERAEVADHMIALWQAFKDQK